MIIGLNQKIYVAGHRGMVGSAIVRTLQAQGYDNIIGRTHAELDLTNQAQAASFFKQEKPDQVYLAAAKVGDVIVQIDPRYYRPTEVETLLGDPTKAKEKLGWVPEITLDEMIVEMVASDLEKAKQHALLEKHGYSVVVGKEN